MEKEEFQNKKNKNSSSSGKEKKEDSLPSDKESAERTNKNIKNNLSEGASENKSPSEEFQEEATKEGESRKEAEVEAEKKKATSSQESAQEQEKKRKKEQDQPASEEEKKVEKRQENDTEKASQKEQNSSLSKLEKEKEELEKLRKKVDEQRREIEKQRKGQKEELKEKREKMKERIEKLTQGHEELRKKREELEQKIQQEEQRGKKEPTQPVSEREKREEQKKKIKQKKQDIDIISIMVTAFFVLAIGGLIFFFFAYNPKPNLSTPEPPDAKEANLSKPPIVHTECKEGKCVEVEGKGESVCEADSECTHTECRGDKCVLVNKKGEDLCQKDKDCKPALPPIIIDISEKIILSKLNPDVFISKIDKKFKTKYEPGTFIELVPKYNGELLTISQLFKGLALHPPEAAVGNLKNYTMYLYSQEELFTQERRNRLGIAFKIKEGEVQTVEDSMKQWEKNLPDDFYKVHSLWQRGEKASDNFLNCKDPDYSDAGRVGVKYTNFPEPDLSIDWAIFKDILIITTSRESMYRTIDRLREQQE